MAKVNKIKDIQKLVELTQKLDKLPPLSRAEQGSIEAEQRFEAAFHSNRLEGNKLTENEARNAVFSV